MATKKNGSSHNYVLDIFFCSALALMLILFFTQALGYPIVSARAPLLAMVPLAILLVINLVKIIRASSVQRVKDQTHKQVGEEGTQLKKLVSFVLWLVFCVAAIYVGGHYAGVFIFLVLFLRFMAKERWRLAVMLSVGMTLAVYVVFEMIMGIYLYRGVIYLIWRGYKVF